MYRAADASRLKARRSFSVTPAEVQAQSDWSSVDCKSHLNFIVSRCGNSQHNNMSKINLLIVINVFYVFLARLLQLYLFLFLSKLCWHPDILQIKGGPHFSGSSLTGERCCIPRRYSTSFLELTLYSQCLWALMHIHPGLKDGNRGDFIIRWLELKLQIILCLIVPFGAFSFLYLLVYCAPGFYSLQSQSDFFQSWNKSSYYSVLFTVWNTACGLVIHIYTSCGCFNVPIHDGSTY